MTGKLEMSPPQSQSDEKLKPSSFLSNDLKYQDELDEKRLLELEEEMEEIRERRRKRAKISIEEQRKRVKEARSEYAKSLAELAMYMSDFEEKYKDSNTKITKWKQLIKILEIESDLSFYMMFDCVEEIREEAIFMLKKRRKYPLPRPIYSLKDGIVNFNLNLVVEDSIYIRKESEQLGAYVSLFNTVGLLE